MSISNSYPILISSIAVLGAGTGFIEALINPLITSIHPENPERYLNKIHAFASIGICTGVIIFGELLSLQISWRLLYIASSLGALSIGLVFQFAVFPQKTLKENKDESYIDILKIPLFWIIAFSMFFSTGSEAGFIFWTASYIRIYHSDIPRISAFGTALFGATMAVGRLFVARLSLRFSIKKMLFIASLCGILVSILLIYSNRLVWILVLLGFAGFIVAGYWPSLLALGARLIAVNTKNLFILLVSSGIGGSAVIPYVMGNLGDHAGLREGFYTIPLLFTLTALLLLIIKSAQSGKHLPDQ